MCFPYAVLAGMEPKRKNNNRCSAYDLGALNSEGLTFPVSLKQIPRFELSNPVSVNVFSLVDNVVAPAYVTSQRNKSFHVNLLLCNQHYYLVKSTSRLLCGFHHRKHQRNHYCHFCLCTFPSIEKLQGRIWRCAREKDRGSKYAWSSLFSPV